MLWQIFGINHPLDFWNFWNCPRLTRAISEFQKYTRSIYPKSLSQTCDYKSKFHAFMFTASWINLCCPCSFFENLRIQWRFIFANVIRCSRLWLWVGYFIYFKFNTCVLLWIFLMFFNLIKEINRLRKKINRLLSKRNVKYLLKSYYWEKLTFSNLRFSKFKKFVTRSVFGELQLTQIPLNFKTSCCNLKFRGLGTKLCAVFLLF